MIESVKTILVISIIVFLNGMPSAMGASHKKKEVEDVSSVETILKKGNALLAEKKYTEALIEYQKGLTLVPDAQGLLYNGGLAAFQAGDYSQALKLWKKLKNLDANDWQVRAKLIQTYQALGKLSDRDEEREALWDLRKSERVISLIRTEYYVREQTEFAGRRIMVSENFELKGEVPTRYVFSVLNEEEQPVYRILLRCDVAMDELDEDLDESEKPLFHLDGYFKDDRHEAYQVYGEEPIYDEVRQTVEKLIEKQVKVGRLP
ncbi:MAG: tetratricopeptide repeat protein [Verrucomicrobiae bacterium]|nr:tetratricopeptide repeat protein [Verrucomicrobiae bacterium]